MSNLDETFFGIKSNMFGANFLADSENHAYFASKSILNGQNTTSFF